MESCMKIEKIGSVAKYQDADRRKIVEINPAVQALIKTYKQEYAKGVMSVISIGEIIHAAETMREQDEFNDCDVYEFCRGIGLMRSSSQYRKYRAIGAYADVLGKLKDRLPQASSTLYQITQFSKEKLLELVDNHSINSQSTLNDIKKYQGKERTVVDKDTFNIKVNFPKSKVTEVIQLKIDKRLNDLMRDVLADIYNDLVEQGIKNISVLINEQKTMSSNSEGELVKTI